MGGIYLLNEMAEERVEERVAKERKDLAANMLREGITPAVAVKVTGLPLKQVNELQLQLAN
jgi:hypothetical protein